MAPLQLQLSPQQQYYWEPSSESRPRPALGHFANMSLVFATSHMCNLVLRGKCDVHSIIQIKSDDYSALTSLCFSLADHAQKDTSWEEALKGPLKDDVIKALHKEFNSLTSTILDEIDVNHPDRAQAEAEAITGRILLDIKRDLTVKARGVKQGSKENKATADGPGFNYVAHVTKLKTVRMLLFRPNRGERRLAIKDVRVAFLQSDPFPHGVTKYVCFKWPLTGVWRYYRQCGPIYGEASAPIRWEDTICPYLESIGFTRGKTDKCAFHHEQNDIANLLWVDDDLIDGNEDDILWASNKLDDRFDCKDLDWIEPNGPKVDYLGMELSQDDTHTYLSMCSYIAKCIAAVAIMIGVSPDKFTPCNTPMTQQIDPDSPRLDPMMSKHMYTMCGFIGWLQLTMRVDVCLLYSRCAQHLNSPNESALATLIRGFRYLKNTINLCLATPRHTDELDLSNALNESFKECNKHHMKFFCDSDYAGNTEKQNTRTNRYGYVAIENEAPIDWFSKCTSVAFANKDIGESHSDVSVAAGEV